MKKELPRIERFDICNELHAMNDFGKDPNAQFGFSDSHTYNAECYAQRDGRACTRRGLCLKAVFRGRQQ
jgi:hypothetical protein